MRFPYPQQPSLDFALVRDLLHGCLDLCLVCEVIILYGFKVLVQFIHQRNSCRENVTIGLVLGPFTALCRSFLKRCTLTNKAVGTIWQALSKSPQRRQGPDPRPPLIVSRDYFSLWTWAPVQTARSTAYFNWCPYIFLIYYNIIIYICVPHFYDRFCWLLVFGLYKEDYLQIFKCVSFWLHGCCG